MWRVAPVLFAAAAFGENLHFTYLWHMEQPVYWPARQSSAPDRYERAWQSIQQKDAGRANPGDDLRTIFGTPDRVAAYQFRPHDTLNLIRAMAGAPEAGVQVSFSGGLIENLQSLGAVNQLGYAANWQQWWRTARGWPGPAGFPRMEVVLFPFHHPLLPLCDESAVRKQVELYKEVYADAWAAAPAMSNGFFPSEMAFSERLIPVLVQLGVQWVVVSNEHLSRACADYPLVLGSGGVNCEPPNRADRLNPSQAHWIRRSISRGCAPVNAAPFAYTPHFARSVDPTTGQESRIVVVPADQALGWMDGYAPLGVGELSVLQAFNPASRPMLLLLAHDGDNAWGGGYSYYMEAVPNFVSSAAAAGFVATTIREYLQDHPVPANDLAHVEDGAWVNADGDFGSPTFLNWNWPLLNSTGQVDIAGGWHIDERNWAVLTAAQNRVDTAEQIECGASAGCLQIRRILYPDSNTTQAERAWHYFNGALNSGFMYYGTPLDHEVKAALACNLAAEYADAVIGPGTADQTPPTVWIPQRWPYNPGSVNFGPAHDYQQVHNNGDFWVWTFAYDVSGVSGALLKFRLDVDGSLTDENRTYAGGAGVGAWQSQGMTRRAFPAGNVYNDPGISFFILPNYIAEQFHAQVAGIRDKMVDYYVEAVDGRGFVKRTPIQHVYVGDGSGAGAGERVVFDPYPGQAGQTNTIRYNPVSGPLAGAASVYLHLGFNQWQTVVPNLAMTWDATEQRWRATVNVPTDATQIDCAFHNGAGVWDNNNGQDWHAPVAGGAAGWTMEGQLEATAQLIASNGAFSLYAERRGARLYVAAPDAGEGADHFIFLAVAPGAMRPAPWAKSGQAAGWDAFLADENNNDFEGWFDLSPGVNATAATGANGGWVEGTIDLAQEFGSVPDSIWLSFGAYATQDGGALIPARQVPASVDDDGDIDAAEYVEFSLVESAPGDLNCDGAVSVSDIGGFVLALTDPAAYAAAFPNCDSENADVNQDHAVTVSDIGPFVALLTQ